MSTDQSHINNENLTFGKLFNKSHRTYPEQFVGLGIYGILSFAFETLFSLSSNTFGILYATTFTFSMWSLWRIFSLRLLKLELSVFLAQFGLQMLWSFTQDQLLLSLLILLLLWCNTLLATMLFWKKEKLSGMLLFYSIVWIFYLAGMNMIACMSMP